MLTPIIVIYCLFGIFFTVIKLRRLIAIFSRFSISSLKIIGYLFFIVTWPVWAFLFFKSWLFSKNEFDTSLMREFSVPLEWLMNKISIQEAEHENTFVPPYSKKPIPIPFGKDNATWNDIKSKMLEGDEVWRFSSPPETWTNMCGRGGVCIVRNGKIVDGIITIMN
jgi:hypothetical protein